MKGYSRLFKANLHRIKGLAILNTAMMTCLLTDPEKKKELSRVKKATEKALQ